MKSLQEAVRKGGFSGISISVRQLAKSFDLVLPISLKALIKKLEVPPPPPPPPPTTPTTPMISVELNLFGFGDFKQLRVYGGVFSAGEQVNIMITTAINGQTISTVPIPTMADSSGRINETTSVICTLGVISVFSVQAQGTSSGKRSNIAGVSC